jgi:hypothetical protein
METQLEKSNPKQLAFVETSMQNFDTALDFCTHMVKSKILPKHYYNDQGNPKEESAGMLLMVLQMGKEIGMSQMMSIQQIIPVNGLMSVKGDGAKALIMASGKCLEWKEWYEGEGDNYTAFVSAKRKDTGEVITRSFSVMDAKRAGLWIDNAAVQRNDRLKYSPWYKYGNRMLRYRALGFVSRDGFGDVLQGISIEEEARDIDMDVSRTQTDNGVRVDTTAGEKNEKLEATAEKSTRSRVVKDNPLPKETPKESPKEEQVQEAVVVSSTPNPQVEQKEEAPADELMQHKCAYLAAPKVKDLLTTNKEDCKQWINGMLDRKGIKSVDFLFTTLGQKMNIGTAHELILVLRENRLESHVESFGVTLQSILDAQTPPPIEETKAQEVTGMQKAKIDIPELIMGSRDFNQQFQLLNDLKKIGIGTNEIDKYLSDNNSTMSQNEFIAQAPVSVIQELINHA